MFYVYILKCADTTFYVGSTNNIDKRLKEHNTSKQGAHYTKIRRPVTLEYQEVCETYSIARKREGELKKFTRPQKLKLLKKIIEK